MAIKLARKTLEGKGWFLSDEKEMLEALRELSDWDGSVARTGGVWQLTLSSDGKQSIIAPEGRWLVLDGDLRLIEKLDFIGEYVADQMPADAEPEPELELEPEPEPEPESPPVTAERASMPAVENPSDPGKL